VTKHDTWVKLKPGNPYEPILDLFADGMIPMRDPFPLERAKFEDEALWIVDIERLRDTQVFALAELLAQVHGVDPLEVEEEAITKGGFAMSNQWVESMQGGPESFARSKELADWLETAPQPPSAEAWLQFYDGQHSRWIEGDEIPPAINSLEDVDERLRTPELEQAMKMRQICQVMAQGNYSVLDVLMGRAMVDALNTIDPNNTYSLVGDDDDFEDDDIYE